MSVKDIMSRLALGTKFSKLSLDERDNMEVILAAIEREYIDDVSAIPDHFFKNKDEAIKILEKNGLYLQYMPDFQDDEETCLTAIVSACDAVDYCSPRLASNEDFVMKTVQYTIPLWDYQKYSNEFLVELCVANSFVWNSLPASKKEDLNILKPMLAYAPSLPYINDIPDKILNLPEIAKLILSRDGNSLARMDESIRSDIEFAKLALANDPEAYVHLSHDLKRNPEILELTRGKVDAEVYPKDVRKTLSKDFIIDIIKAGRPFGFEKSQYEDEDIQKAILDTGRIFYLDEGIDSKEIAKALLSLDIKGSDFISWSSLSEDLKEDKDFIIEALQVNPLIYQHLSDDLKGDREVVKAMLSFEDTSKINSKGTFQKFPFHYLPLHFKHDDEIVRLMLERYPSQWTNLTNDMQTKDNVLIAIKHGLHSISVSPFNLKDADIYDAYVRYHPENLHLHQVPSQKLTKDVIIELINKGALARSNMLEDRDVLMAYISAGGRALSDKMGFRKYRNDLDVALAVLKKEPNLCWRFSEKLRNHPEVIKVIREFGDENGFSSIPEQYVTKEMLLKHLNSENCRRFWMPSTDRPKELSIDFEVVLKASQLFGSIEPVPAELKNNREFLEKAAPYCPDATLALERLEFIELHKAERLAKAAVASESISL